MLSDKQIRMLELLDEKVMNCNKCSLHNNGTAKPFWTPYSRFACIGEAPGANEVREKTPFVGAAGKILTEVLDEVGFDPKDFLIINSVQCRPVRGNSNGKPTESQIKTCISYVRKYLKVIYPEKILCLGNYAKYIFTGNLQGILRERGRFMTSKIGEDYKIPVLFTVHPAYCIYNVEEGMKLLRKDVALFKEKQFPRYDNWLLSEDDFRV